MPTAEVQEHNLAKFGQTQRTSAPAVATGATTTAAATPENLKLLVTAGGKGGMLTSLNFMPLGSVTACAIYYFLEKAGSNVKQLKGADAMGQWTANAAAAPPLVNSRFSETASMRLEAGDKVYYGLSSAQPSGVAGNAEWTDF